MTSVTRRIVDATGRVVGVGPGQLVDERPVQVGRVARRSRARARRASRRRRSRGYAGSSLFQTGIGLPQNRLREIDQSRVFSSHLPNWPSLMCSGTQRICWLSSSIRSRIFVVDDEPRRHRHVDQRLAAAPAVRVGVLVGLAAQQHRAGRDRPGVRSRPVADRGRRALRCSMIAQVGVEDVHARVVVTGWVNVPSLADRHDRLDALAVGDRLVLLTEGAGAVHQPGAVLGGDEVGLDHAVAVGVAQEVGERRRVAAARAGRGP